MEKFIPEIIYVPVDFDPFAGGAIERTIPSTEAQREVFIASLMGQEASCSYNESVSLELTGRLDVTSLEQAIQALLPMHEALRGCISADGMRIIIHERMDIALQQVDLTGDRDPQVALERLAEADMTTPFDLVNGPVFRCTLVRLTPTKHLLRLTGHHVLVDGWSLGIIMGDLSKLYSGQTPTPAVPFSEFALAVIDHAKGPEHSGTERFWLEQFSGTLPRLDLPTDRPRPRMKSYRGARIDIALEADLVRKLKELATRSGASLVTTLLTCYEMLLHQVTGQTDLVVGLPAAGQNGFDMKQLVGHCVNLLALRSHVDEDKPFIDHLKERRGAVLDAGDHQKYTFGTLVRKLNVPREPGRVPLVPAVFNVDMNMDDGVAFAGLAHRFISNPRHFENFELFLNATGSSGSTPGTDAHLTLEWSYNTDLFDAATIHDWMRELHGIIERAHAAPQQRIATLVAPPPAVSDAPLPPASWNGSTSSYPRDPIDAVFDRMCDRYPDHTAVELGSKRTSYAELRRLSNALAAELVRRGLNDGEPVGVCFDKSIATQTAMLAILKAGGCYVPFDLTYPEERVRYMLDDARPRFMLTAQHLLPQLPGMQDRAILLDEVGASAGRPFPEEPLRKRTHNANSPAYILYTSGSTGKPKGVVVPHRGVVRLVREQNYMTFGPDLAFLQMGNLCFDASTFEIWGALLNGARLVVQPQVKPTLREIATTLREHKVTSVLFPTGLFNLLVDEHLDDLKGLKNLVTGGDVMSATHARKALAVLGPGVIVNAYGPTENSVIVTCHAVDDAAQLRTAVPIGKPISNTEAYILDDVMRPVPVGATGELYAGGDGVALGYWQRAELTADRFVPDPFTLRQAQGDTPKLYRTGDLARWRPDGSVEFMGRADTQVKLRGFRIELGEIEAAMDGTGRLKDRVVVCREDRPGDKQLVAYLVAKDGALPEEELIHDAREHLRLTLPAHMLPSAFVVLPKLPLNQSGKVDRKALPKPHHSTPVMRAEHVAPRTPTEKELAALWSSVLGVDDIGAHDNFFDLGGHSLTGIALLTRVEQFFGRTIPLKNLYIAPTVALMAGLIEERTAPTRFTHLLPIQTNGTLPPLFCVHGDEANNFLPKHLGDDQPFYAISHQGEDGMAIPLTSVETMAEAFIAEMRQVRPHGPYHLCGYSFGGIIAYEVAQQLVKAGEEVPVLVLFDTYDPKEYHAVTKREAPLHLPLKASMVRGLSRYFFDRGKPLPVKLRHTYIIDVYNRAIQQYEVIPYRGHITLLRTADSTGPVDMGWEGLARGGVEVRPVPGNHYTMVKEPHVATIAAELKRAVDASNARNAAFAG